MDMLASRLHIYIMGFICIVLQEYRLNRNSVLRRIFMCFDKIIDGILNRRTVVIRIDTAIGVIMGSLTAREAHHSSRAVVNITGR